MRKVNDRILLLTNLKSTTETSLNSHLPPALPLNTQWSYAPSPLSAASIHHDSHGLEERTKAQKAELGCSFRILPATDVKSQPEKLRLPKSRWRSSEELLVSSRKPSGQILSLPQVLPGISHKSKASEKQASGEHTDHLPITVKDKEQIRRLQRQM